jgi:hypothetical protein
MLYIKEKLIIPGEERSLVLLEVDRRYSVGRLSLGERQVDAQEFRLGTKYRQVNRE